MARNPSTARTSRPASGRGRPSGRRDRPGVVSRKQRPWGWIAAFAVVVVAGAAVITYAVTRPSATAIAGIRSYSGLSQNHVTGPVSYPQTPPAGGDHDATPLTCGIYDRPVRNENAVHSLEHGALWITYRPGLPTTEVNTLKALVRGNDHRLLSPYRGLPAPIVATAWGKQLYVDNVDDPRLAKFAKGYTSGPTTPEPGAACRGTGTPTG